MAQPFQHFHLTLSAKGFPTEIMIVRNLKEAVAEWCQYRDANGFGAFDMKGDTGDIHQEGKLVARVSYNGRLWSPEGNSLEVK